MKGDFVIKFLSALAETAGDMGRGLSRVPYKGFRYSDFDRYGERVRKTYVGFRNLENRGIIKKRSDDNFDFTKKGQKWLDSSLKSQFIKKSYGKWDNKWRIVIFDIPQEMHKERVKLRRKLKMLGLEMLQRSVFVFPYSCEEVVGDICGNLGVSDYVDVIVAESVGSREDEFRLKFEV